MIFRFGEHYYLEGASSFFETLFVTILGALIGVLGSLYIFRKTIQQDSLRSAKNRQSYLANRMLFISMLLEDILDMTSNQKNFFLNQAKDIKETPYEVVLPKLQVSCHLIRLKAIDSQDIFQGFTMLFGNSEEILEKYKSLLGGLDFIDERLKQVLASNENYISSSIKLRDRFKALADNLYSIMPNLRDIDEKFYNRYFSIFNQALEEDPLNIRKFNDEFCVPLFEELKTKKTDANVLYFVREIRKITTLLHELKANNLYFATSELETFVNGIDPVLNMLNELNKELKSKFL